jgi:hypothetical protein
MKAQRTANVAADALQRACGIQYLDAKGCLPMALALPISLTETSVRRRFVAGPGTLMVTIQ